MYKYVQVDIVGPNGLGFREHQEACSQPDAMAFLHLESDRNKVKISCEQARITSLILCKVVDENHRLSTK